MTKYNAKRTKVDGLDFDSKAEARRYQVLRLMERGGEIHGLTCHPRYPLVVNEQKICTYVGDFLYRTRDGKSILEDVKGVRTPVYRLKKKLLLALYGIEICEVTE